MHKELDARQAAHANAVRDMFSGIAPRYDLLNHVLSLNIDKAWRRRVRDELKDVLRDQDAIVLDVACGTGDLSIELKRDSAAQVIGTDFCRPMLAVAKTKTGETDLPIPYVEGDAMRLSFGDNSCDAVTIAFGLRNLADHFDGLVELNRILKPGGKLVVLEFSDPIVPGFKQLFNFYFSTILPRIGGAVSGSRGAYEYLPDSVRKFPSQNELVSKMTDAGFRSVEFRNLTLGIAALHIGVKR